MLSGLFLREFAAFPPLGAVVSYFSFEARKSASTRFIVASRFFFESSHPHIVMTVHDSVSSRCALSSSRAIFFATFSFQNSTSVLVTTYFEHLRGRARSSR